VPIKNRQTALIDSWRYLPGYGGVFSPRPNGCSMTTIPNPTVASTTYRDGRENPDTVNVIVQYKNWNLSFESSVPRCGRT
jgi:hypothetical protein